MKELLFERALVGDKILISLYDIDEVIALPILEETYNEARRLEKIFNIYDKQSELSNLNKRRDLNVTIELLEVISKALNYSKLSNGLYDITLGKNFLERKSNKPLSKLSCSYKDIIITENKVTLNHKDILIDLGSIAKGYIVDKIVEFLQCNGIESGFIDARGDMRAFGDKEEIIEIQHPRDKSKTLSPISIKDKAVATSGDYNQFQENYENSHIINKKEIISATIIAETALEADAFASVLFVTNKEQRESILRENTQIKALLIDKNLNIKSYNRLDELNVMDITK